MWSFAAQSELVPGTTIHEKFERLTAWGYDGIEVSGRDLLQHASELRRAMEEFPVRVTSACAGFHGWLVDPDPHTRARAIAEIKEMLAVGAALGTAGLISPAAYGIASRVLPPQRPVPPLEDERQRLVAALREIVAAAQQSGGTLLLEPLNRYADRVINTLAEGAVVVEQIASPHLKLVADTFHMNIEEADMAAALRQHLHHIGHIHLSDSNRQLPGLGHIDFATLFAALHAGGYAGTFAIECMMPPAPADALPRALAFLRRVANHPS